MAFKIFTQAINGMNPESKLTFERSINDFCNNNVDTRVTWLQSGIGIGEALLTAIVEYQGNLKGAKVMTSCDEPSSSRKAEDLDDIGTRAHL